MTRKNLKHMYAMTGVNMGDHPSGTIAIVSLCKTAEMSSDDGILVYGLCEDHTLQALGTGQETGLG